MSLQSNHLKEQSHPLQKKCNPPRKQRNKTLQSSAEQDDPEANETMWSCSMQYKHKDQDLLSFDRTSHVEQMTITMNQLRNGFSNRVPSNYSQRRTQSTFYHDLIQRILNFHSDRKRKGNHDWTGKGPCMHDFLISLPSICNRGKGGNFRHLRSQNITLQK